MKRSHRLLGYLVVVWLGATINFVLPRLLPGDPVEFLVGEETSRLTPRQHHAALEEFGLDRSLPAQYGAYLGGLVRLDLGTSVSRGVPVAHVIGRRLPWTVLLVGTSVLLAFLMGIALACVFHWARRRAASTVLGGLALVGSLPPFWVGMMLIAVFAAELGWLPSHGALAPDADGWNAGASVMRHAFLPITTLTLSYLSAVFLLARGGLEVALGAPYVALARAHGATAVRVFLRHAAPNVVLPLANQLAMSVGTILGGTIVVESVFAYPGLGLALYEGIVAHDLPLVQGLFLLLVVTVVLTNAAADAIQMVLDPRLRTSDVRLA